jgi:hypothetical protein
MKKILFYTICIVFCTTFISGCTTTVKVPVTPCCRNPYHDHYIAPPMLLWTERVTTDSYSRKIEERFWIPTK